MELLKPFIFQPFFKSVIWGGDNIARFKGITTSQRFIGESWEISGVEGAESIVADGPDRGLTLPQLIEKYGAGLVGERCYRRYGRWFPLLIKIIDAHDDLSVQVHPDDTLAQQRHNSSGKSEMWYVIATEGDGPSINVGLTRPITRDDYERMAADGSLVEVIKRHCSHPGDVFYIPAGRIHSIGAGNLILEVQQASDITYRIFDYNRTDAYGNRRQLHVELARDAIDYTVLPSYTSEPEQLGAVSQQLVVSPYFVVRKLVVTEHIAADLSHRESFITMTCIEGEACVNGVQVARGSSILVPAATRQLIIDGSATFITASL